jgi:hypothetical protein
MELRGGDRRSNGHDDRLKLADLGLDHNQSKRWQQASLPEEEYVRFKITVWADSEKVITQAAAPSGQTPATRAG